MAYGTDIEKARELMITTIYNEDWVMKDERIERCFWSLGIRLLYSGFVVGSIITLKRGVSLIR